MEALTKDTAKLPLHIAVAMKTLRDKGVEFVVTTPYGGVLVSTSNMCRRNLWPALRLAGFKAERGSWQWSDVGHRSEPNPEAGMGATEHMHSDSHAYTISRVAPSFERFWMRPDNARRTDQNGLGGPQLYEYEQNPFAAEIEVTLRSNGRYRIKGPHGSRVGVGYRSEYYDPSF